MTQGKGRRPVWAWGSQSLEPIVQMGQAGASVRLIRYYSAVNNGCHIKCFLCGGQCVPDTLYLRFLTESLQLLFEVDTVLQVEEIQVLIRVEHPVAELDFKT